MSTDQVGRATDTTSNSSRVASLAEHIVAQLDARQAMLKALSVAEQVDKEARTLLIADIWRLADELNAAIYVEHVLARLRNEARLGFAGRLH